jgi:hypothetical protein
LMEKALTKPSEEENKDLDEMSLEELEDEFEKELKDIM